MEGIVVCVVLLYLMRCFVRQRNSPCIVILPSSILVIGATFPQQSCGVCSALSLLQAPVVRKVDNAIHRAATRARCLVCNI